MADDDTWLDSFPVNRTDYPLPFDHQLQAKPAYWGVVDPKQLPGYGLHFALTGKSGVRDARVWTVTATNGDAGPAYATQITAFTLEQVAGRPCTPTVTAPSSFPVLLGDIATSGTASAAFTIDFAACGDSARFNLRMPWSSATYHTGVFHSEYDWHRGQ